MRLVKYVVPLGLIGLALWLVLDAMTFALMPADPATGRAYGCYTAIELLIGAKSPSWIRTAEWIMALALVSGSVVICLALRRGVKKTAR